MTPYHLFRTTIMVVIYFPRSSWMLMQPDVIRWTTVDSHTKLSPSLNNSQMEYICVGGLQVDVLNSSQLLVSVCTAESLNISAAVGFLSFTDLSGPITLHYGNITAPRPSSGAYSDGITADIVQPEHLYQTADGSKILFVDTKSCAREVNRTSGEVITVIGSCGNGTLDIGTQSILVNGMTYIDDIDMWVFSIGGYGVYGYTKPAGSLQYVGRELVALASLSDTVTDGSYQLLSSDHIVWHKVKHGVNRYNVTNINSTNSLAHGDYFIRLLSSTGDSIPTDNSSAYKYEVDSLMMGDKGAHLDLSPDGHTLLIADSVEDKVFLLDLQTGDLSVLCADNSSSSNATSCTMMSVDATMWMDDMTILMYSRDLNIFSQVRLQVTATSTDFSRASISRATADPKLEEGTWWVVMAFVSGFCGPLSIIWIVIKVIQIRRNGIVFDIFSEEEEMLQSSTWRSINFLYNKATLGQEYHCKEQDKGVVKKKTKAKLKPSRNQGSAKSNSVLHSATEAIASKFKLPKLGRKKKVASDETDLHPVKDTKVKAKSKHRSKRDLVDIEYAGGKVSVPMTKTLVGRARPLPAIPTSQTL